MVDCIALNLISAGAVGDLAVVQDCERRARTESAKKTITNFVFNFFMFFLL